MVSGLVVVLVCSFESARAKDDDTNPKKRTAGGPPPASVQPKQVAPAAPRQVAPAAPKLVEPQPAPKAVLPSTQPQVGKSSGTPLQPFQPNKAGGSLPGGNVGGDTAQGKPRPGGTVLRPDNPLPGTTVGTPNVSGPKNPPANSSGGIGPAPTGVRPPSGQLPTGPGNPLKGFPVAFEAKPGDVGTKPQKTFNESRPLDSRYGVAPARTNSVGKPKFKIEPGTLNPVVGGNSDGLTSGPKGPGKVLPTDKYSTTKGNIKGLANPVEPGVGPPSLAKDIPSIDIKVNPKGKGDNAARGSSVGTGAGKPTLGGQAGDLPPDPKGTVDINTPTDPAKSKNYNSIKSNTLMLNKDEKLQPLVVHKPGGRTADLSKGEASQKKGAVGAAADGKVQRLGSPQDDKLHSLLQAKNREDLSRELKNFKIAENESPHPQDRLALKHLNLDKISGVHQERLAKLDNFQHWQQSTPVRSWASSNSLNCRGRVTSHGA